MTHGHTRIKSRGACIYCGRSDVALTDEHVVPLSLGGQHVLEGASCASCANVTTKFERDVARDMWGDARNSYNAPSRRKKERKTHILQGDSKNPERRVKVPYADYPAPMAFYKMGRSGLLEGMPATVDLSGSWQIVCVTDNEKAKKFEERFGVPLTGRFRHMPESFARLLAKVGYCHFLCTLDPGDFRPICLPYIMGRANPSYVVGGSFDIAAPEEVGYRLSTCGFVADTRLMLVAEIRLFANAGTPTYHVVVGDVIGADNVAKVLAKIGEIVILPTQSSTAAPAPGHHWSPSVWPLPFWTHRCVIERLQVPS
jgi:hypothetical protein